MSDIKQILIIKHGALGDLILATGPMQAIRNTHPDAQITLLTSPAFAPLMQPCPWIDRIWTDPRPKWWQLGEVRRLIGLLRSERWHWVYDLQTSRRSTGYFRFFRSSKPYYSGLHLSGSHAHNTPERTSLHTIERQKQQLAIAEIHTVPAPNIDWLCGDISTIKPTSPYALIVAGGSAHRPAKRWPAQYYMALCAALLERDIIPVLIGTRAEAELLATIAMLDTRIVNACNRTSFGQIAELARHARCAVGNDTGPMHIIAAAGCQSVVLFNLRESNPDLCAPRGEHVAILSQADLETLMPEAVLQQLALSN